MVEAASFRLVDEVRYIQRRAAGHDGRVVIIRQLTLFSSETGDAWLLDRDHRLALPLARHGDAEPFHIEETDTPFAIDWKGHYRIEDPTPPRGCRMRELRLSESCCRSNITGGAA